MVPSLVDWFWAREPLPASLKDPQTQVMSRWVITIVPTRAKASP